MSSPVFGAGSSPDLPHPLIALGWSDRWDAHLHDHPDGTPGRVLRHDGRTVFVAFGDRNGHVPLRPATPPLAVGDWIVERGGLVDAVLARSSALRRRDPSGGGEQLIAANIDLVGIVCGLDRPVNVGRIQRFTSLAWDAGATPLVILNKADLVSDPIEASSEILDHDPFAEVVTVSSTTTIGVEPLLERCRHKTLVLVGESGAGKSTLANALAGFDIAHTGRVRHGDHKGRHTTTARQLHVLGDGCCLIDTPGVREVGLVTDTDTIDEGFPDIAELAADCRFSDCGHASEPGCAIRAAIESGVLSEDRLSAWDKLRREAAYEERRSDVAARRSLDRSRGKMYRAATKARKERD